MICLLPRDGAPIDQADIFDGCPIVEIARIDSKFPDAPEVACSVHRVVVLTQTCDLANSKTERVVVAILHQAEFLVSQGVLKAADIRGAIRAGRVFGWYFLPAMRELGIEESIIDLRQLFTVPIDLIRQLAAAGKRRARIQPLYREHLAKHFADTYSRIGLPEPYETQ